jgi:hypothetical protein
VPRWAAEAVGRAGVVVLAIALRRLRGLDRGRWPGGLVVGGGDGGDGGAVAVVPRAARAGRRGALGSGRQQRLGEPAGLGDRALDVADEQRAQGALVEQQEPVGGGLGVGVGAAGGGRQLDQPCAQVGLVCRDRVPCRVIAVADLRGRVDGAATRRSRSAPVGEGFLRSDAIARTITTVLIERSF